MFGQWGEEFHSPKGGGGVCPKVQVDWEIYACAPGCRADCAVGVEYAVEGEAAQGGGAGSGVAKRCRAGVHKGEFQEGAGGRVAGASERRI